MLLLALKLVLDSTILCLGLFRHFGASHGKLSKQGLPAAGVGHWQGRTLAGQGKGKAGHLPCHGTRLPAPVSAAFTLLDLMCLQIVGSRVQSPGCTEPRPVIAQSLKKMDNLPP